MKPNKNKYPPAIISSSNIPGYLVQSIKQGYPIKFFLKKNWNNKSDENKKRIIKYILNKFFNSILKFFRKKVTEIKYIINLK